MRPGIHRFIKELLVSFSCLEEHLVVEDASLVSDLGLDSLDQAELIMAIEDEYCLNLKSCELAKVKTFKHLVDLVERKL